MRRIVALVALANLPALAPLDAILVGSTAASLLTIDPATGAAAPRCTAGATGTIGEIEAAPDGTLYAATSDGSSLLFMIDPDDCAESVVGEHFPAGSIDGLEFVGDTLYGAFSEEHDEAGPGDHPSVFVLVHVAHGGITALADLPFHPVRGLAWNEATGVLYGIGPAIGEDGAGDLLFTIDLSSFATATVGPTGHSFGGLEFGTNGVLYAGEAGEERVGGGAALHAIDPLTGSATPIGAGSGASSITGLAFLPEGASPIAVPALSPASAGALAVALAFAGVVASRRAAARRGRAWIPRPGSLSGSLSREARSTEGGRWRSGSG